MSDAGNWLADYGERHSDISNPGIYWVAVPILIIGTVGVLWSLPVPGEFQRISSLVNWGSVFLMAAAVYYFVISVPLAIGMLPFMLGISAIPLRLQDSGYPLVAISAGLIALGVAGLFVGHYAKGGVKAVLRDIHTMMIAPVWILSNLYRRLGIPF